MDRYAYVSNNPLRYIDPSGHVNQENCNYLKNYNCERPKSTVVPAPSDKDRSCSRNPMCDDAGIATSDNNDGKAASNSSLTTNWSNILGIAKPGDMIIAVVNGEEIRFIVTYDPEGNLILWNVDEKRAWNGESTFLWLSNNATDAALFSLDYDSGNYEIVNTRGFYVGYGLEIETPAKMPLMVMDSQGSGYIHFVTETPGSGWVNFIVDLYNAATSTFPFYFFAPADLAASFRDSRVIVDVVWYPTWDSEVYDPLSP